MRKRIERIMQRLQSDEALLITSDVNRRYLTGFASSAGVLVITSESAAFLVDSRYIESAKKELAFLPLVKMGSATDFLNNREGIKKVYIEAESMSLESFSALQKRLKEKELSADAKWSALLREMRAVKDSEELSSIREAQKITDEGFAHILSFIKEGKTEREIALELEFFMRKKGSEGVAFDFIVVSGENSSMPHGVPTERAVRKGDFITMDFGAVVNGYRSDMTRTVAIGEVSPEQEKVYNTVLAAQEAALKAIKNGAACKEVDKAARELISAAGYGAAFGHGLGHSVGLEIHESPSCSPSSEALLKSGMLMTVEPGIYLENRFGVRIEDLVCVTDDGYINLTQSEKKLIKL